MPGRGLGIDDNDDRALRRPAPEDRDGKVIAVVVILVGIGFVAVLTGAIAQRFIARVETSEGDVHAKLDAIAARLERLEAPIREYPSAG
jgi:hypothetical protein